MKIILIIVLFGLVAISSGYYYLINKQDYNPRSVILISVDTLRYDRLGINGYKKNLTPHIDLISKHSLLFDNVHTIAPLTPQSFFALHTGLKDPLFNPSFIDDLKSDYYQNAITISKYFQKKGYHTAEFITNPVLGSIFKNFFKQGFDETFYYNSSNLNSEEGYKYDYDNSLKLTDDFIKWLSNNYKKNTFSWIHFTNPHMPYNPKLDDLCIITNDCNNKLYSYFFDDKNLEYQDILPNCKPSLIVPDTIRQAQDLYDAEIMEADREIGRIISELNSFNLLNKSLIIIYSDHGEGFDHSVFGHGSALYESSTHIPFLIYNPHIDKSVRNTSLLDNTDLFQIIINVFESWPKSTALNIPINDYLLSISSRQQLKMSIINNGFKYIRNIKTGCDKISEELYDLKSDPDEKDNLIVRKLSEKNFLSGLLFNNLENKQVSGKFNQLDELRNLGY